MLDKQRVRLGRPWPTDRPTRRACAVEPTGNFDTRTADDSFALLRDVKRAHGNAFVIVTLDPRLAQRCERQVAPVDVRIHGPD